MAWWVGYNEDDYEVTTINGRNINDGLLNWFGSLNWASTNPETPEPNDKLGKETCVRMKEGYFNDAMCYVKHQGPKRKISDLERKVLGLFHMFTFMNKDKNMLEGFDCAALMAKVSKHE